ncbi:MAG: hypothetical protein K9M94_09920 [Spirochaetia bacterium]|nr:hypothetical protein [Spirochaetia bacterium]
MDFLIESLEHELSDAFEVKNRDSLHRCVLMLANNMVTKAEYSQETARMHEDFRALLTEMHARFDAVDKHFDAVNQRFEERNQRFEALQTQMDKHFEAVNQRFEEQNQRFEALQTQMDRRFEEQNKRFDDMNDRFTHMFRFMSLGFTLLAVLITVLNFL